MESLRVLFYYPDCFITWAVGVDTNMNLDFLSVFVELSNLFDHVIILLWNKLCHRLGWGIIDLQIDSDSVGIFIRRIFNAHSRRLLNALYSTLKWGTFLGLWSKRCRCCITYSEKKNFYPFWKTTFWAHSNSTPDIFMVNCKLLPVWVSFSWISVVPWLLLSMCSTTMLLSERVDRKSKRCHSDTRKSG